MGAKEKGWAAELPDASQCSLEIVSPGGDGSERDGGHTGDLFGDTPVWGKELCERAEGNRARRGGPGIERDPGAALFSGGERPAHAKGRGKDPGCRREGDDQGN